jgi:hypothetical protein
MVMEAYTILIGKPEGKEALGNFIVEMCRLNKIMYG